jgi:putative Holliday junction resolvase
MRTGNRVGIDVGKARIGVARSDLHGMLATPIETVPRTTDGSDLRRIIEICRELDCLEVIVGLPLSLAGSHTPSTQDAVDFAAAVQSATGVQTRMIDERLTTVSAQSALHRSGRTAKSSRPVIDQVAAVILLQQALDTERASGTLPGISVTPEQPIDSRGFEND